MNSHPQWSGFTARSIIQEVSRRAPPKTITSGKRRDVCAFAGCLSHPWSVTPSAVLRRTSSTPLFSPAIKARRSGLPFQGRNKKRCSIGSTIRLQPAARITPASKSSRLGANNLILNCNPLKLFRPRPQFHIRRPTAAMLAMKVEISLSDRVGVEAAVGTPRSEALGPARRLVDAAVDHHLGNMNILRLQLTR